MALTLALLTCFVLIGLGLTVVVLSLLESLFGAPAAAPRRIDTRRRAAESLIQDPETFIARTEMIRNVSQCA